MLRLFWEVSPDGYGHKLKPRNWDKSMTLNESILSTIAWRSDPSPLPTSFVVYRAMCNGVYSRTASGPVWHALSTDVIGASFLPKRSHIPRRRI